jgi:hypothetical protein
VPETPRKGAGFCQLDNHLYEAVLEAPFTDVERAIVLALLKLTHGWNRRTVTLPTNQLAELSGCAPPKPGERPSGTFRKSLKHLLDSGVVVRLAGGKGSETSTFWVQPDYERWNLKRGRNVSTARLDELWRRRPKCDEALLERYLAAHPEVRGQTAVGPASGDVGTDSGHVDAQLAGEVGTDSGHVGAQLAGEVGTDPGHVGAQLAGEVGTDSGHVGSKAAVGWYRNGAKHGPESDHLDDVTRLGVRVAAVGRQGTQNYHTPQPPRASAPAFDPSALPRWDELCGLLAAANHVTTVTAWLARIPTDSRYSALSWSPRFAQWLTGHDRPPSWKLTPEILATALSEYPDSATDFSPAGVWAFVENICRRFERAAGDAVHLRIPPARSAGSGQPASLRHAVTPVTQRARELYALGRQFELLTFDNQTAFAARMERAAKDPRAGAEFMNDLTAARLWDGIGTIRIERFKIDEIANRLEANGWRPPVRQEIAAAGVSE